MSKEALAKVVQRAISDGAFRRQLTNDPNSALRGFDLSPAETAAIRSGDPGKLSTLGVDVRMSKAYGLAGNQGYSDSANMSVSSDVASTHSSSLTSADGTTGSGALTSGDGASGSGALISGNAAMGSGALISGAGAAGSAAFTTGDGSMANTALIPGDSAIGNSVVIGGEPAHALGDQPGDEYLPSFNTLTPGDSAAHNVVVSDDGASGASTPGEAGDGPNIQP